MLLSAVITGGQPWFTMRKLFEEMKIWAVAAIGAPLVLCLGGLFSGDYHLDYILYVVSSFVGAEIGIYIIYTLTGEL